jgi:hypothetical protein
MEPNILVLEYEEDIFIDVKVAEENHTLLLEYLKDKPEKIKLFVIVSAKIEVTPQGRMVTKNYNKEMEYKILCQAIVVKSYLAKILSYVYVKILNPKYESKIFTSKEKALGWLNSK